MVPVPVAHRPGHSGTTLVLGIAHGSCTRRSRVAVGVVTGWAGWARPALLHRTA